MSLRALTDDELQEDIASMEEAIRMIRAELRRRDSESSDSGTGVDRG